MPMQSDYYGRLQDGRDVYAYTMTNENGMRVQILEYGCAIAQLWVPDKTGALRDVVLGYDDLAGYEAGSVSHGALVGRHANRIAGARFVLDEKTYPLPANNGPNHLHGTFSKMVFQGEMAEDTLVLRATSPDGDDGFPGNVRVEVSYTLTEENALVLDYRATTDAPTLVNLTNHSYFNLEGRGSDSVLAHTLQISAKEFCEGNAETCPTGVILPVAGTPFDFTTPKSIGEGLAQGGTQLELASGFDHNYVLDKAENALARVAVACAPASGIVMETYTTQPGMQLYTANFLHTDKAAAGKDGAQYKAHGALCLETQHFPCAPSYPHFPSVVLRPKQEYHQVTTYRFGLAE